MFDLGWSELLLIGVVALIVVGPKDLPNMFRALGRFTGKARGMAREFSRAMEAAADDAGVKDINKTLRAAANPVSFGKDHLKKAVGDAAGLTSADKPSSIKPGGETEKLSQERAAARDKILEATAKAATERKAREAAAQDIPPAGTPLVTTAPEAPVALSLPEPVTKRAPARKTTARTAPADDAAAKPAPRASRARKTAEAAPVTIAEPAAKPTRTRRAAAPAGGDAEAAAPKPRRRAPARKKTADQNGEQA